MVIPAARHTALATEWESIYGKVWKLGLRYKHQGKALDEYSRRSAEEFFIVPFLGDHAGPTSLGRSGRQRTAGYECHGSGELPDLSGFSNLDFFVAPPDFGWTMLHTHEDYEFGGPYFVERDLLVPPTRKRGSTHP